MSNLSEKLLTLSLADFLLLEGKKGTDFIAVGIECSSRSRVCSGAELSPIQNLEQRVKNEFLEKLPKGTVAVVSLQKNMGESPSAFFSEGTQYVSYLGTALILKN